MYSFRSHERKPNYEYIVAEKVKAHTCHQPGSYPRNKIVAHLLKVLVNIGQPKLEQPLEVIES